MKLDSSVFDLDLDKTLPALDSFIAKKLTQLGRHGIVVPLSGGLDSSTAAALCVRSVGTDKVTALLLPDKKGSKDAVKFANILTRKLGIKTVSINTTRVNRAAGVYNFIINKIPAKKLIARFVRQRLKNDDGEFFKAGIAGTDDMMTRKALASIYAKQRLRMVVTCHYADLNRLMVVGSAHKSEDLLGLFVKFGVDDMADLMPLKNFFRTQVLMIARKIGVPEEILRRTPNPEMIPGVEDKYNDVLHVSSANIDLILWGIENGINDEDIATAVRLPVSKITQLRELVHLSAHMRAPSQFPVL